MVRESDVCVCAHVRSRMGKEHIYEYVLVRVCELVQVCVCVRVCVCAGVCVCDHYVNIIM